MDNGNNSNNNTKASESLLDIVNRTLNTSTTKQEQQVQQPAAEADMGNTVDQSQQPENNIQPQQEEKQEISLFNEQSPDSLLRWADEARVKAHNAAIAAQNATMAANSINASKLPADQEAAERIRNATIATSQNALEAIQAAIKAQQSAIDATTVATEQSQVQLDRAQNALKQMDGEINELVSAAEQASQNALELHQKLIEVKTDADNEQFKASDYTDRAEALRDNRFEIADAVEQAQLNLDFVRQRALETHNEYQIMLSLAEQTIINISNITGVPMLESDQERLTEPTVSVPPESMTKKQEPNIRSIFDDDKVKEKEKYYKNKKSTKSTFWDYCKIILLALLIAVVLRTFVFEVTRVDGLSMYNTLNNKDDLITLKISYLVGTPKYSDIVVLDAPDVANKYYIKRVIGMPNDHLIIKDNQVFINGKLLNESSYIGNEVTEGDINMVIPDGYYFVMGDNREESRDSRSASVGVIAKEHIIGKAVFRIYPFNDFGLLD